MKKALLAAIALIAVTTYGSASKADTYATTPGDPLHLFCTNCSGDNGTFNPFVGSTATGITVTASPGALSATDFFFKVLIPQVAPGTTNPTVNFSGTVGATAFNKDATSATTANPAPGFSNQLFISDVNGANNPSLITDFLGLTLSNGAPPNRLNTFLDSSTLFNSAFNAFTVLTVDVGPIDIPQNGQPGGISPFSLTATGLPIGAWILGDACTSGSLTGPTKCVDVTTATSAALLSVPGPAVGAGIPGIIAGCLGLVAMGRRRINRLRDKVA